MTGFWLVVYHDLLLFCCVSIDGLSCVVLLACQEQAVDGTEEEPAALDVVEELMRLDGDCFEESVDVSDMCSQHV